MKKEACRSFPKRKCIKYTKRTKISNKISSKKTYYPLLPSLYSLLYQRRLLLQMLKIVYRLKKDSQILIQAFFKFINPSMFILQDIIRHSEKERKL